MGNKDPEDSRHSQKQNLSSSCQQTGLFITEFISTRSEGIRSRFISPGNTRNDTDRNLQVQPKLALSYKGQLIQLHFEATPEMEPNTFTTEEARNGTKLIAPGRQESMRFEDALTLSRRAVKLHRQAVQTNTGMDNSTPGSAQQRWKIQMDQAPTFDKKLGFVCSLAHSIGFTSATHEQTTNSLGRAPPSSTDLENVIFTDNSSITKAIEHLKLTATYNDGDKTKLIPRSQALANRYKSSWSEFNLRRHKIPAELIDACYTQDIRDQIPQGNQDEQRRPIVLFCDQPFPTQSQLQEHLRNHHGIDLHSLPRAIPRLPAQLPRAIPSDSTTEVITKLRTVLSIAKERSEWSTKQKTPLQVWRMLKEHINQFFEHTPMLFVQFINVFEKNKDRTTTISSWLTAAWDMVKDSQQTHKFLTPPTPQETQPFQPALNRTTKEAISNVSQAGQSANQRATDTGNAPLKKNSSDDSLGPAEPRPIKTTQDKATDGEKQGEETTQQVTNTPADDWHGNAEHTDPDVITSNEPKDQEALMKEQRTKKPGTMGQTSPQSTKDRTPQSDTTNLQSTPINPRQSTPHEPTEETKRERDNKSAQEMEIRHKTETVNRWATQGNQISPHNEEHVPTEPAKKGPTTEPSQPKEIEVTISIKAKKSTAEQCIRTTGHRPNGPSIEATKPVATLKIKIRPTSTETVPSNNPSRINSNEGKTVDTSNTSKEPDVTKAQRADAHETDWYSLMLEDETKENATPKDMQPHRPTQDTTSCQQDEQNRSQPRIITLGAGQTATQEDSRPPHIKPHLQDRRNQGQPQALTQLERAKTSDTTEIILKKLERIRRIIQKQPQPTEQCAIPILLDFLPRETEKVNLTLLLTLCHEPGQRIPLDRLSKCTAAAWELTKNGDKPKVLKEILGKLASKKDTQKQIMNKYKNLETRLLQFSTKFSGKPLPNGDRELTTIEWGWMHALLEAFMLRISSGKKQLEETTYQATGINMNQLQSSKTITCGDLAKGIKELWKSGKYVQKTKPATKPTGHPQLTCILELEFIGTTLTPRSPETSQGKALHVRIPAGPDTGHHAPQLAQTNPQIGQTPNQPARKDERPTKEIREADKQETVQPTKNKHIAQTIHYGRIYHVGNMKYKFLKPGDQEPITMDGHEYLKIGSAQRGGTPNRQYILLDRENATAKKTPTADLQLLKKRYKCPFKQNQEPTTNKRLVPGHIYSLCSGATISFCKPDDKSSEGSIGTIQQYKVRFTAIRMTSEAASPHPHANQDPGHPHGDTPTNSPDHTGSHPTHTGSRPGNGHLEKGHLENGHLVTTQNIISDTSTVRPQQPSQQDVNTNATKYHPQTTPPATQQPEPGDMKQRPDAADAGNFLRRQIKSPGDFSRSNAEAFLKFEDEIDHESIRDNATATRLRKKAPSKLSLASTIIRNTLLLHEDIQAGQCSRYQCQKPRTCFLARKSKQAAGSLYDSWKCYKPPLRREGQ